MDRPPHNEGRDALLDATERVIATHGFRGLTYRRVAAEAGLTHGLVTYHFGTLDALVQAALERASRNAVEGSRLEPESGRLEDFAADLPRLAAEEADGQAFQFELALEARRRPELRDEVRAQYEEYFAVTRRALERAGIEAHARTGAPRVRRARRRDPAAAHLRASRRECRARRRAPRAPAPPRYSMTGKPRSTPVCAGSGQRGVMTLPRV